jgi:hypothetical protein
MTIDHPGASPLRGTPFPFWRAIVPIALLGTLLSLFFTGFQFGVNNNVFHVPYVLDWASLPQFSDDQFYQTLKYFTSGVWPPLRLIATESNVASLFLAMFVLTRLLTFIALAILLAELGLTGRRYLLLGILSAAATPWLQGASLVGEHGLFVDSFAHSEFSWPFVIGLMICLSRRHLLAAAFFAAIILSINAFIGIWMLFIISFCLLLYKPYPRIGQLLKACLLFALLVLPISIWVASALMAPHPLATFRFSEYIRAYFPYHFLIDTIGRPEIIAFLCLVIAGLFATRWVDNRLFWKIALLGELILLAIGTVLPYIFDNKIVFDLHFLRVTGIIQFFNISFLIVASIRRLCKPGPGTDWIIATLLLAALIVNALYRIPLLVLLLSACQPLGALALALHRQYGQRSPVLARLALREDQIALFLACVSVVAWGIVYKPDGHFSIAIPAYFMLVLVGAILVDRIAARHRSVMATTFILLAILAASVTQGIDHRKSDASREAAFMHGPLPLAQWIRTHPIPGKLLLSPEAMQAESFQLFAKTSVWVDYKQGAAVLWYPSFYLQWSQRYQEVRRLTTLPAVSAYASAHRIPYLAARDEGQSCPAGSALIHKEGDFLLCKIAP